MRSKTSKLWIVEKNLRRVGRSLDSQIQALRAKKKKVEQKRDEAEKARLDIEKAQIEVKRPKYNSNQEAAALRKQKRKKNQDLIEEFENLLGEKHEK